MSLAPFPAEETQFEVWQGGLPVAIADTLGHALNYLRGYQQDGPAEIVVAITKRIALDALEGGKP